LAEARIAVVDDDEPTVQVVRDFLEDEGYEIVTQADVRKAYAFVKQCRPSLVILDLIQNREMIGLEMLDLLKLDPETRDLPIIVVSVDAPALRRCADRFGLSGVSTLDKPYSLDGLLSLVRRCVQVREPGQGMPCA